MENNKPYEWDFTGIKEVVPPAEQKLDREWRNLWIALFTYFVIFLIGVYGLST